MSKSARIAAPALQPDPPADPPAVDEAELLAASAARIEHRLRLLDELAEMAMKMARGVTEEAATATDKATSTYAADDFAKLSRAVRLTLDLAGRLEESLRALRAGQLAAGERNMSQVRNCLREKTDKSNIYLNGPHKPPA